MPDRMFATDSPEVPPDAVVRDRGPIDEPTQKLLIITAPPPKVEARAVLVYEQVPRRPWRLWAFAAVLVALTVGVIVGQAHAFEPFPAAQAAEVPAAGPVTAALGAVRSGVFEVVGDATVVHVVSADLGDLLYSVDGAVVTPTGSGASVRVAGSSVEVRVNRRVAWTLRLAASASDQEIDMRDGGLAGVFVAGRSSRVVLRLPAPVAATSTVSVTGPVDALAVSAPVPVRARLGQAVSFVSADGKSLRGVKAGAAVTPAAWAKARHRYDVTTAARVNSLVVSAS